MLKRIKAFIENIGIELFATCAAQGIYILQSVIQNKIFTTCFSSSVFGTWSLLMSIYTLVSMLPFTAFDQGVNRVAAECRIEKKEKELYGLITILYMGGFVGYFILFFFVGVFCEWEFIEREYFVLFMLYIFSEIIKNTFVLIDNAYRNKCRVLIIRLFELVSRGILLVYLHSIDSFKITNVLFVLVITNVLVILYQWARLHMIILWWDRIHSREIFKKIVSFSLPLMTWAVFGWMQNMISRWYLDAFLDLEAVASYSVLTSISYFVPNAIYSIFSASISPIVYERNTKFTRGSLLKYISCVAGIISLYVVLVCVFGKQIIILLTDVKYVHINEYLPLTTISASLYVLSMLSTIEIFRRNQTKKLLLSTIMPGMIMATVGMFLIKEFGFDGAVGNYMLGHITYLLLTSIVVFNSVWSVELLFHFEN